MCIWGSGKRQGGGGNSSVRREIRRERERHTYSVQKKEPLLRCFNCGEEKGGGASCIYTSLLVAPRGEDTSDKDSRGNLLLPSASTHSTTHTQGKWGYHRPSNKGYLSCLFASLSSIKESKCSLFVSSQNNRIKAIKDGLDRGVKLESGSWLCFRKEAERARRE